jgi:hypothetical protein
VFSLHYIVHIAVQHEKDAGVTGDLVYFGMPHNVILRPMIAPLMIAARISIEKTQFDWRTTFAGLNLYACKIQTACRVLFCTKSETSMNIGFATRAANSDHHGTWLSMGATTPQ